MERFRDTFDRLRQQGRKALIPFIMGADPDAAMTRSLLLTLEDAGADAIEVGIPFSDPLADGPIIQAASARALQRGATPQRVLETIASVRHRMRVPVLCLSYWNPLAQCDGPPRRSRSTAPANIRALQMEALGFAHLARASGIAGVIVPDLPIEESLPWRRSCAREGLAAVFLAAPTSPPARLRVIARGSEGFIYYVSLTGTTGVRDRLAPDLVHGLKRLRAITAKPVCVGFGISTPAQAAAVARIADGVIVGSALVQVIHRAKARAAILREAAAFVGRLRSAIRSCR